MASEKTMNTRVSHATIPESGSIITSMERTYCPACGSSEVIDDSHRGERICTSCGTVIEEKEFDFSADRRAFTAEEIEKRKHNGGPITALTDIAWTNVIKVTDRNGNADFRRIIKWNSRLSWEKKNFLMATNEIKRVCAALSLPRVVAETAATYYKKMQKLNVMRGRSINGFVGACVYLACRVNKIPRSVDDVYAEMPDTTDRDIRICFKVLVTELGIKLPRIDANALLPRFASALGISQEATGLAEQLMSAYGHHVSISGKDPKGIIAAAIYIACKNLGEITAQKLVAEHCGVTEVTMRSRIKEFTALKPN